MESANLGLGLSGYFLIINSEFHFNSELIGFQVMAQSPGPLTIKVNIRK